MNAAANLNWLVGRFVQQVAAVRQAVETSGLVASRLELDLTESTVMTEGEETTERLRQLRELGVQLAGASEVGVGQRQALLRR